MKPNSLAKRRPLFAPAFISTRALAVVMVCCALACVVLCRLPWRASVPTGFPKVTPEPAKRQRSSPPPPASAAVIALPQNEEHRSEDPSEEHDPFAAAAAIPDPALRDETLARLCYQHAESDPCGALELAAEHGLDRAAGGVIGNLTQQWAAVDLRGARAWVKAQPESALREELVARIGYVWSLADPEAAADFVALETPAGEVQIEAAISVLHQWSRRDPAAARAWAERFPEGEIRERALLEVGGPPPPDE
jgi:hypothetical protein